MAVPSIAGSIFVLAVVAASSASAEDAIKSGNWEYSVTVAGVTQLPSGMPRSPDMRLGPEGLTFTRTSCITAADPFPPMANSGGVCKADTKEVTGGTLHWSATWSPPRRPFIKIGSRITTARPWMESTRSEARWPTIRR